MFKTLYIFPKEIIKNLNNLYKKLGLPRWCSGKESICQCRRCGFDPWIRKIPWRRKCNPLQCSCLKNPLDREARQVTVHVVSKGRTQLSDSTTATARYMGYLAFPVISCAHPFVGCCGNQITTEVSQRSQWFWVGC